MSDEGLRRLRQMAELVLEQHSAKVAQASAAREAVRLRLAALDRMPEAAGQDNPALQMSWYLFETWAVPRRVELQRQAARCEADWLNALSEARRAFARVQLLSRLPVKRR